MKNEPKTAKTEVKTAAATAPKAAKIEEPVQKAAEEKSAKAAVKKNKKKVETKAAEKAETVKTEVKSAAKKTAAAAKKTTAAAKKTTAAAKKTAETAVKKVAAPKTTETVYFQFFGNEVNKDDLVARIKDIWTKDLNKKAADFKDVKIYVKFEECAAYYVVNGEVEGRISL